jgi:hypothetical protein
MTEAVTEEVKVTEDKPDGIKPYDLNEAIGKAKEELAALTEITEIHIRFLARKNAPANLDQLAEALHTNRWVFLEPSQEGRLLLDTSMGVFAEFIEKALFLYHKELSAKKVQEVMETQASEQLKRRKYGTGKSMPLPKK